MGDPVRDEAERIALKRAEAEATATKNTAVLVAVRRRQRERDVERARRAESLDALQVRQRAAGGGWWRQRVPSPCRLW